MAMHENILKRTFYWGSIGIQESVTEVLNYVIYFEPFQKVSRCPDFSKVVSDLFCSGRTCERIKT